LEQGKYSVEVAIANFRKLKKELGDGGKKFAELASKSEAWKNYCWTNRKEMDKYLFV
jgi:hypothetical protein